MRKIEAELCELKALSLAGVPPLLCFSHSLCFPTFLYASLTQTYSREREGDNRLDKWFPSSVHFPERKDEGTISLASNELPALFEDKCIYVSWISPESTSCLISDYTSKSPLSHDKGT